MSLDRHRNTSTLLSDDSPVVPDKNKQVHAAASKHTFLEGRPAALSDVALQEASDESVW